MKTTAEWIFLCAAHKNPAQCCALEYTIHTIDSSIRSVAELSRLDSSSGRIDLIRTHARRLVRILLHAAHHHPDILVEWEQKTFLCKTFCVFCLRFDIIPAKQLCFPHIPELGLDLSQIIASFQ
ncbi:hypothetical protein GEMRC1_010139 [Eukaryota sp. GEM-RC1]